MRDAKKPVKAELLIALKSLALNWAYHYVKTSSGVKGTCSKTNHNDKENKPTDKQFLRQNSKRNLFRQSYEGQALLPMVLFILMGVLLLGVVVEVGNLFIARRQLQNDADSAATWGAMQLDIGGLRISDGSSVHVISPGDSEETADLAGLNIIEFMSRSGYATNEWNWEWGRCTMQINIRRQVPTVFVSIMGVREVPVAVSAKARLNNTDQKITCG